MGFFDKLKVFGGKALEFGKKNASSLTMGGGIVLSWTALFLMWQESGKAAEQIRLAEEKLNEGLAEGEERRKLSNKEKLIIFAQYCWPGVAAEAAATGLSLYSHKLSADEIAKWYMVSQFFEKKSDKQEKLIDKLEAELPDKKVHELENDLIFEEGPDDQELIEYMDRSGATEGGGVWIVDNVTGREFQRDILKVTNGIASVNETLRVKREKKLNRLRKKDKGQRLIDKIKDPFFASDKPFNEIIDAEDLADGEDTDDYYNDVYSSISLNDFWDAIGERADSRAERKMGDIMEFRYYGGGDLLKQNQILKFKKVLDPETGEPRYGIPETCYLDYESLMSPTGDFEERDPL